MIFDIECNSRNWLRHLLWKQWWEECSLISHFFSKPGNRWERSGGIWGKDKLEAARWFLSQATTPRSLQVLKIQFQTKIFPFWREGKMCFSVILLPGPATFAFLPGKKNPIFFGIKVVSIFWSFLRLLLWQSRNGWGKKGGKEVEIWVRAQKVAQKGKWPIYPPCSDASKLRKHCQVAERPIDFPAVFGILSGRDSNL